MGPVRKSIATLAVATFLAATIPAPVFAADSSGNEQGDDGAILLDLVVLRPIGLVATIAGTAAFIVSLPIALPTGSVGKTFNSLVKQPAKYTFYRTLGEEENP
jgi:hypothetical protein